MSEWRFFNCFHPTGTLKKGTDFIQYKKNQKLKTGQSKYSTNIKYEIIQQTSHHYFSTRFPIFFVYERK